MREATTAQHGRMAADEPFQLVKFFSFASLLVLLFTTLVLTWVISKYARGLLMERSKAYSLVLAENLNHQILSNFVLPTLVQYRAIQLSEERQYRALDRVIRNTIHGMNVERVTIYDSEENIISYSTDPALRGRRDAGGREYEQALTGKSNSVFVAEGAWWTVLPGGEARRYRLRTYVPLRISPRSDRVMGVLEVVLDLSGDFDAITRFQGSILGVSLVIMGLLFLALRFIVVRAERIMAARAAERRRLEEKLNQAERLAGLGKMVASVSHEIKNPLGIVKATAEILQRKSAPETAHLAAIIVEEAGRLDGIVREFLDFARPPKPRFARVRLDELCERVLDFAGPELEKRGVELRYQHPAAEVWCEADGDLLYRALLNIVVNGIQAMAEGGVLAVTVERRPDGSVACAVADTGPGMDEETRAQIFHPFFTTKHRGTGLGLAIVKNIVDSHHGRVEVESAPGRGTVFRIVLPVSQQEG